MTRRGAWGAGAAVAAATLAACSLGSATSLPPGGGATTATTHAAGTTTPRPAGTKAADGTVTGAPFSVTIAAAGDVLVHVKVRNDAAQNAKGTRAAYDFRPMFALVKPLLSAADVAICHMETPLSQTDTGMSTQGILIFNTPHEVIDAVKGAGYDGCDFASNHTWDQGLPGLKSTQAVITGAGLQYAGPTASASVPRSEGHYVVGGIKITQLAYAYTILNDGSPNTRTPAGAPWMTDSLYRARGVAGILADARRAKAAGADLVVISFHWGNEYQSQPNADQQTYAKALLASKDVDLILGTHVHVVQPCQTVNGKLVFYGLGNSLSNQAPSQAKGLRPETQEGMVATVTVKRDAAGRISETAVYQPTWVDLKGHVITLATKASRPTTWDRVTRWVGSLGAGKCTATPTGG